MHHAIQYEVKIMNGNRAKPLSPVSDHTQERNPPPKISAEVQREILHAVAEIQYGSVEVVIQDGRVVQIESREKRRIQMEPRVAGPHSITSR
jgi:hypothetical protein